MVTSFVKIVMVKVESYALELLIQTNQKQDGRNVKLVMVKDILNLVITSGRTHALVMNASRNSNSLAIQTIQG